MPPSTREVLSELERRQFEALREVARNLGHWLRAFDSAVRGPRTPEELALALESSIQRLGAAPPCPALLVLDEFGPILREADGYLPHLRTYRFEGMMVLYRITLEALAEIRMQEELACMPWTHPPGAFPWQVEAGRILLSRHNARLLGWSKISNAWVAHVAAVDGDHLFTNTKLWRRRADQKVVIPWDGPEPDEGGDPECPAGVLYLMLEAAAREPEWE